MKVRELMKQLCFCGWDDNIDINLVIDGQRVQDLDIVSVQTHYGKMFDTCEITIGEIND